MNKLLACTLVFVVAAGVPCPAAAADPADTYPDLHLIPWPKSLKLGAGHMPLTAGSRIIGEQEQLRPLAEVLSSEIALLTGLKLKVASAPAGGGDMSRQIDKPIRADEPILVMRGGKPMRTADGAHTIAIGEQAVVTGFDYRATAEGSSTILQLLGQI